MNRDARWGEPGVGHSSNRRPTLGVRVRATRPTALPIVLDGQIKHHPCFDLAGLKFGKDGVDAFEGRCLDVRADLALGGKRDRFIEILARADDRASDRDPLENDIEDRRGKRPGRQTDKRDRSFPANHAQRLRKGGRGHGRDQHAVRAPAGGPHDFSRRLGRSCVNGDVCPGRLG